MTTQSFGVAHGSPTAPSEHWKSQGTTSMHSLKPEHSGVHVAGMHMLLDVPLPVELDVAPVLVEAVELEPVEVVEELVMPPAPPIPLPVVTVTPVPLDGVILGGSRFGSSHATSRVAAVKETRPSERRGRIAVDRPTSRVRGATIRRRPAERAVLSPPSMRFTTLFVAFALSAAVAAPAVAGPRDAHSRQAKGKPKKPKTHGTKKKQGQPLAPRPTEVTPVIRALPVVAEPSIVRGEADAGLALVASRRDDLASASLVLSVPFGARDDARGQDGSALVTLRALEHALAGELRALRAAGGDATFSLGPDASMVSVRAPTSSLPAALDLVGACFVREITQADVDAVKSGVGATSLRADAEARLFGLVYQGYFPYEHPPAGTAETREKLDAKVVSGVRDARWVPALATLAIAAPSDGQAMIDLAKARFSGPRAAVARAAPAGELQEQTNQRTADLEAAGAPTTLYYAWAIRSATPSELAALEVAAELLSTRGAVEESVAKLSLASNVRARVERRAGADVFVVEVDLPDTSPIKKAKHAVEGVFLATSTKAATPLELAHAREALWIDELTTLDDPIAFATRLLDARSALEDRRATLEAVTPEAVRAAAAKFLGPLTRTVVELHDPARAPKQESPAKPSKPTEKPAPKQESPPKPSKPTEKPAVKQEKHA